uniref:DUF148 domain-containing protein n=1 Tax=Acrobeloides nanus TaxID=290746 RepID=A0A914EA60_9BILA
MLTKLFLLFLIGYCFGQQQFGQQPVPPFLYGASQATINSFHQLTQTFQGLPEADIEKRVGNWINGQSADIRARYTMMRAEEKERSRWREAEQAEMAAKLSPAAQAAERRFSAIAHDPRLTPQEKYQQTMQFENSLSKNVVDEIDQMFQNQMQQHQQQREEHHRSV